MSSLEESKDLVLQAIKEALADPTVISITFGKDRPFVYAYSPGARISGYQLGPITKIHITLTHKEQG